MNNYKMFIMIILLFILPNNIMAANITSLFFYPDEIESIDDKVDQLPTSKIVSQKHLLHLDSILYFDKNHWTVWVQGKKITTNKQQIMYRVSNVTADKINLTAKLKNGHMINVTLSPHQSLNLLTGYIVGGY